MKNSIFYTKYVRYEKNVEMENYLPKWGLEFFIRPFFDKMYILCFDFKNTFENKKFNFLTKICEIWKKRWNAHLYDRIKFTNFVPFWDFLFLREMPPTCYRSYKVMKRYKKL